MFCSSNEEKMMHFNYRQGLTELNFDCGLEDRKIELKSLYVETKTDKCLASLLKVFNNIEDKEVL